MRSSIEAAVGRAISEGTAHIYVRTGFFMAMVSAPCPPMECPQMPTVSAATCVPKLAAMTLGSSCRCPWVCMCMKQHGMSAKTS